MKFKKSMLILIMAIFLVSLAGVCASDANDAAMASEDNFEIDQTADDAIGAGEDMVLASSEENEILSADERSLKRLNEDINGNSKSEINLTSDYLYMDSDYDFDDGIVINRDLTINGNGHIINGGGEARIFQVTGGNVVFYNITFTNGHAQGDGGAIHGGHAVNCIFKENSAIMGGAIYGGSAVNCTFIGNTANLGSGGAIWKGSAVNCTFIGNTADYTGGAIYEGSAVNCTFSDNTAGMYGNAMSASYKMNCTGQSDGDYDMTQDLVLHWDANNFTTIYGSAEKLPIQLMNQENWLIDFINYDAVIYKNGSKVKTYHCLSNDWLAFDLPIGIYTAELIVTYPGIVKPEPKNITLTIVETDGTTFWDLINLINNNTNDTITLDRDYAFNSTVDPSFSEGIIINRKVTINGNGHTIDAKGKARVFDIQAGDVTIENLTIKNANSTGDGGAIFFSQSGSVINCNFADNQATGDGGAVYFYGDGTVLNCSFVNNTAFDDGGALYSFNTGDVTNCNFIDNTAFDGSTVFLWYGAVTDCSFVNNWGTGIFFMDEDTYATVINCSFINNWGLDIFMRWGDVTGCSFVNSFFNDDDYGNGGAVDISDGAVINCSFVNCSVYAGEDGNGGAVDISDGAVINCSFVNCSVYAGEDGKGGAVDIIDGDVINCSFVNCSVDAGSEGCGGAVDIVFGDVINCSFVNCSVDAGSEGCGGAVYFNRGWTVENCNFTSNNAAYGSAIYFDSSSDTKTVSNSIFLNNRANAADLEVTKNEDNITIIFTGNDNLINAIYSEDDDEVTFTNVTYWGVGEKTNTGSSPINLSGSNNEAGMNITVGIAVDNVIILNNVYVTDEEGTVVLDIKVDGNYLISVRHDEDSYYGESVKIMTNTQHCVNVTSQTTHNRTVNITAKSNIPNEIVQGKLQFIMANGDEINATYAGGGIWWAEHTFEYYGDYQINASYVGLGNVTVNNATISISKANSTVDVSSVVMYYGESKNVTVETEGATAITAKINNVDVGVVNNYTIPISGLDAGNYTLAVTTIPDEDHNSASKAVNITVNKAPTEITVASATGEMSVGAMARASAELNPSNAGNLTYTSNDTSVVNVSSTGIIKANGAGTALITVSFAGSDNYAAAENRTIAITVNLNDASVSVNNSTLDLFVGDNFTIVATTDPAGLNVTFVPDNSGVCSVDENGTVTALKSGTGSILVKVGDGKVYAENSTIVAVTVSKIPTEIIVQNATIDMKVGDEADLDTSLMPSGAGELDYTSDDVSVVAVNGIGTITAVGEGIANVTVRFTGNDKYAACESKNITVTVTKTATEIAADPVTATYNVNKNLVITLKDANGNPLNGENITVDLNGAKNYTTDENGSVNVSTKGLAPGTYVANITFNGTNVYVKSSGEVNVTVKKATPKITAKAKTFKTTTKTKKLTVILKNNIKKPIKKATIYLKVGGKTYKATTNSKGKATFKITKLAKKGTYKATVTFKANKYYKKATKKVKITVKAGFKTVSKGSKNKATVKEIQRALKNNGYYLSAYGHYLKIDGVYHGHTEAAVKQFQKDKGLKVTGKVDEKTAKKLKLI